LDDIIFYSIFGVEALFDVKIPFERFIITFLILGKDVAFIVSKLKEFHYHIDPNEVSELLRI